MLYSKAVEIKPEDATLHRCVCVDCLSDWVSRHGSGARLGPNRAIVSRKVCCFVTPRCRAGLQSGLIRKNVTEQQDIGYASQSATLCIYVVAPNTTKHESNDNDTG